MTQNLAFIGGIGWPELLVIALLALLLFGSRLPSVMRSLGKGVTEFKKGIRGIDDEIENAEIPPPQIPEKKVVKQDTEARDSDKTPA